MAEERSRREEEARRLLAEQAREKAEQLRRQAEEREQREREEAERLQKQVGSLGAGWAGVIPDEQRNMGSESLELLRVLCVLSFSALYPSALLPPPWTSREIGAADQASLFVKSTCPLLVSRKKKKLVFVRKQRRSGRNGRSISREKSRSAWRERR